MAVRDWFAAAAAAVLVLLAFLSEGAALADPHERPSARMVLDRAFELRAEVRELEAEFARAKSDPEKGKYLAVQLAEARAHLAEAEGRRFTAAEEWRKVIAHRTERMHLLTSGKICCSPGEVVICRGQLAEARCQAADLEGDAALLAAELPKVIAGCKARIEMYRRLREAGAIAADDSKDERVAGEALRRAEERLDIVKKKLSQP
jgi:hypothetical protein